MKLKFLINSSYHHLCYSLDWMAQNFSKFIFEKTSKHFQNKWFSSNISKTISFAIFTSQNLIKNIWKNKPSTTVICFGKNENLNQKNAKNLLKNLMFFISFNLGKFKKHFLNCDSRLSYILIKYIRSKIGLFKLIICENKKFYFEVF